MWTGFISISLYELTKPSPLPSKFDQISSPGSTLGMNGLKKLISTLVNIYWFIVARVNIHPGPFPLNILLT